MSTNTMAAAVALTCQELTNQEIVRLNLLANWRGQDPHTLPFYEKVAHLFTEDNGQRMHADTLDALARVVLNRLDK